MPDNTTNETHDSPPTMSICLLGASFGTDNFGVNVLTLGTIRCALETFPDADLSVMDYGYQPLIYRVEMQGREISVPLLNIRFSKKPWQPNHILFLIGLALLLKVVPSTGLRKKILQSNRILKHLCEVDIATALSGGDSFSDIYGLRRFFYVSLPQILVILLKKPLVLLPQTLGPFKSRTAKSVARYIIRNARTVFSRDTKGLEDAERLLNGNVAPGKLRFSHDVGFVVDAVAPNCSTFLNQLTTDKQAGPLVGINVSGLLFKGGYNQKNMFGLKSDYAELTRKLIAWFLEQPHSTILLVPHVYGAADYESDATACAELQSKLEHTFGDRVRSIPEGLNERETKYVIGQCDFFVGARMHACIAALSQCVPTVPIAYSDKFIGVMRTIGAESLVADPRAHDTEEILAQVRAIYDDRIAIRRKLESTMPQVKLKALGLFENIGGMSSTNSPASQPAPLLPSAPPKVNEPAEPVRR